MAGGPAHLAIESLKASGFDLQWIDKYPVLIQIYPLKIYNKNGSKVTASKLKILGIKTHTSASPVAATQQRGQVVEVGEFPSPSQAQFVIETNPSQKEAAEVEAINQTIKAIADESTVIFPVKLAAKPLPLEPNTPVLASNLITSGIDLGLKSRARNAILYLKLPFRD